MEDITDCESLVGVFTLVKKVESKQKSSDYFKKGDIRKTIQLEHAKFTKLNKRGRKKMKKKIKKIFK